MDTVLAPNQPQIESQTALQPAKPRRRAIDDDDAQFIADRVAEGMTELDAVNLLNKFTYNVWNHWKAKPRQSRKVQHLFARTRAARQHNLIESISIVGDISRTRPPGVRHDWRAAQMLAGLNDERFRSAQRDAATTTNNTQVVIAAGGQDQLRKLVDIYARQALPPAAQQPHIAQNQDDPQPSDKPLV